MDKKETNKKSDKSLLNVLIGNQLVSVTFVMDYIQLRFDGPQISAYTLPSVVIDRKRTSANQEAFKDKLCSFISQKVNNVYLVEGAVLTITFENGNLIEVSLKPEDYIGPEAVMFWSDDKEVGDWEVW